VGEKKHKIEYKKKMEKGVLFLAPEPKVDEVDNDRNFGGCYHGF